MGDARSTYILHSNSRLHQACALIVCMWLGVWPGSSTTEYCAHKQAEISLLYVHHTTDDSLASSFNRYGLLHSLLLSTAAMHAHLGGKEVEVGVGVIQERLVDAGIEDAQDFGVGALAEEADAAVGRARNDAHAATRAAVLHHIQHLERRLCAHQTQHHPVLPAGAGRSHSQELVSLGGEASQ